MTEQQLRSSIATIQANIQKAREKGQDLRVSTLQQNLQTRQRQLSEIVGRQGASTGGGSSSYSSSSQPSNTSTQPSNTRVQEGTAITDQYGNIVRPDLLEQSAYQDDSDSRQQNLINNLNQARQQNPASLADANTFRYYYNYEGRSDVQKQTLDNWYNGYSEGRTLAQQTARTLADQLKAGTVSQAQLANLQVYDPEKYANTMKIYEQGAVLSGYNNQLNPQASENPFQGIIDNLTQNLSNFSQTPKIYDQYKEQINSPEMKELMNNINTRQTKIEEMDLDILNAQKSIEKRYEGSGITRGKLNAIINDEIFELSNARSNLAIQMNSAVNKYNSQMSTISQDLELQLQDYQLQQQAQTMQMQQIGMLTNLMSYETPQQQSDRAFADLIRQQEYLEGNIYSNDPATRKRAVSNAVDNILQEFAGIPMVRSREQMIQDIQTMVDNGTDLGTALTKNLREPIMQKPEYKNWLQQKFPPQTVSIGGIPYSQDSQGNLYPQNILSISKQEAVSKYGSTPAVRNFNPGNITDTSFGGRKVSGERFTVFDTPEQGFAALIAKIEYNQSNPNSKYYNNTIKEYFEKYAPSSDGNNPQAYAKDVASKLGVTINTKISQVDAPKMAAIIASHEDRNSFRMLRDLGIINADYSVNMGGGTTGNASDYNPDNAELYDEYLTSRNVPAKYILEGLGITVDDFIKQANAYKSSENYNRETSFKTQDQALAFGFAQRVQSALPILKSGDEYISGMSTLEYALARNLPNWAQSSKMQQQMQAERDFVNAILRRESGAAIAKSEFTSAQLQYFPQPGDSKEVIAQKERNRMLQLDNLARSSGNYWYFNNTTPVTGQTSGGITSGHNQNMSVNLTNSIINTLYPTGSPIINTSNPLLR